MTAAPLVLEARSLHMTFHDRGRAGLLALDDMSLQVAAGEYLAIVGPSGCGKSTLLRLLAGLLRPISGEVLWRGEPLTEPRREIGFVFQRANLMPWRTVLGNIMLPLEIAGLAQADRTQRAHDLISLVNLEGFADAYPSQLSGGMQQRVTLARALVYEPSVLLLDEPFGALDALTRERMNAEMMRIWSLRRPAVVMVTHSISEAVFLADRVIVMSPRPGRVRAEFAIPLPRPRDIAVTTEPEFVALTRAVRAEIVD
ncbi:MAG: Aliphatic sulfonates import ATP-binding protein SsuB [Chloroflexi bacterium ADurb.Bin325]|nr:MAG: Aliphatic sulfonates import ATP-binding protein SsuB [Chloroflexi bacterium ADurb.Bin325]